MAAGGKGRIRTGIDLAKASWKVLRSDSSLLAFPIIGAVAAMVAVVLLFAPGIALFAADDTQQWPLYVFGVLALYGATFVATFCAVALAACASESLEGHDTSVSQGLAAAKSRLGAIAAWSLLSMTVGLLLNLLQNAASDRGGALAGAAVGIIGGAAWAVASFFAIPVIALEGVGPMAALKRSASIVKARWGEGAVGTGAIGIVMLPGVLLAIVAFAGGASLMNSSAGAGLALIGLGFAVLVVVMILSGVLNTIFRVALFRFATEGSVPGGFAEAELESAFAPKKPPRVA